MVKVLNLHREFEVTLKVKYEKNFSRTVKLKRFGTDHITAGWDAVAYIKKNWNQVKSVKYLYITDKETGQIKY